MKTFLRNFNLMASGIAIIAQFTALVVLLATSCIDEEIGPCYDSEQKCKTLLKQMEQATTEKEKEQYRQFYLAEKHFLDNCRK